MKKSTWNHRWSEVVILLGSAGCQPAVRGSLPRTLCGAFADRSRELLPCALYAAGKLPAAAGWQPALPCGYAFVLNPQPPRSTTDISRDPDAVRTMFGRIARRYDLANHILSGGADFLWRRRAAKIIAAWRPRDVLDLATGSGDLALAIQRRLPEANITAADFSPEMLEVARRKGVAKTILADALQLPFDSESFDCVTVAFGLRNMADWDRALHEMSRVLRPQGHLFVLDFSIPSGALRPAYRFYLHHCLPLFASIVTGQKAAYDYLGGSIEKFPSGRAMLGMIEKNGFATASAEPLTGGIATIYTAQKA